MTETNTQKTPIPDYPRGISFEQVWAALMENREQVKETSRQMGLLNNRFGEMVEHLVAPSIVEKFNELGFNFHRYGPNVRIKKPGTKDNMAEIDILLENSDTVIAVEVKAKATQKDVKEHIKRMLTYAATNADITEQ